MTRATSKLGAAAALVATAALAGCGGGPSKAEFVKKADAICTQTNKAHPPKASPKNPKEAAAQQAEEIQIRSELDRKLRGLEVPDSEKKDFAAYNARTQTIIAALRRMKADAEHGDDKKYRTDADAFTKATSAREGVAIKLGFKVCSRRKPVVK